MLFDWYDSEVAAAAFEPVRAQSERNDEEDLAKLFDSYMGLSLFDSRAAVARPEQAPIAVGLRTGAYLARERVVETLSISYGDRWQWVLTHLTEVRYLLERDIR